MRLPILGVVALSIVVATVYAQKAYAEVTSQLEVQRVETIKTKQRLTEVSGELDKAKNDKELAEQRTSSLEEQLESVSEAKSELESENQQLKANLAAKREKDRLRASQPRTVSSQSAVSQTAVAGNLYAPGNCTWYVKNRRADLPNNLGNANTWAARAAAYGYTVNNVPAAGAVGQQGGHVVYIESVNDDGTVNVSDMNWAGLYVVTYRTVPAWNFTYIHT